MAEAKNAAESDVVRDTVGREEFSRAVKLASEVYRSNSMGADVMSHSSMTFDGNYVRANTFAAAIQIPLDTKFQTTVDGKTLSGIIGALGDGGDDVDISVGSTMVLKMGSTSVEATCGHEEAQNLLDCDDAIQVDVSAGTREQLVQAFTQALRAAGETDVRYYLNGIHLIIEDGNLVVYGSDGLSICRANTGIKGFDKIDGLSLTRDTAESWISIAEKIGGADADTLMLKKRKDGGDVFGYNFSDGVQMRAPVLSNTTGFASTDLRDALKKLEKMNKKKLKSVATPEGMVKALSAGRIAAESNSPVKFFVKGGVMTVETGDINQGIVFRSQVDTEIADTEGCYNFTMLSKLAKNPATRLLFYHEGPLFFGNVDIDDSGVGVQTYLMPLRA